MKRWKYKNSAELNGIFKFLVNHREFKIRKCASFIREYALKKNIQGTMKEICEEIQKDFDSFVKYVDSTSHK